MRTGRCDFSQPRHNQNYATAFESIELKSNRDSSDYQNLPNKNRTLKVKQSTEKGPICFTY